MKNTYRYGIRDLKGKRVPDSKVTPVFRDMIKSTGDYATDFKRNIYAYNKDGIRLKPLCMVKPGDVKFIAGLWRIQEKINLNIKITQVRDKRFILGEKIDHIEKNLFEYYHAAEVCENCYGIIDSDFDYIVAKYDTDNGPMWSYGATIEQARAFLGIALFDKHINAIHAKERKNFTNQK